MINKIIKVNSKYKDRVKSFIDNKELYIKPNFSPIYIKNLIDWEINKQLSKTEEVYLHSLLIIKDLTKFSLTEQNNYFKLSHQIIEKWWDEHENNELAWNEHAVAERTLNLLYFQENSSKKLRQRKFNFILYKHLDYLYSSTNYKNNNHGLMMDRSLLIGSYYINDVNYRERAIDRFNVFIYRDFSRSGIHLENSPEYHTLAIKIVKEFIEVLDVMKIEINKDIDKILRRADIYIQKLARPDRTVPLLGDSGFKLLNTDKLYGNISDHTSGVFLYQDLKYNNWLLSSNGYQSRTHKHKDDMSIQFSIDSLNILIDSGKYNYDSNSEIRNYLLSDSAHSKPYIIERQYKFDGNERLKTNIILNTEDIYHIELSYMKPRDFQILRNVILHKKTSSLIIVDRFSSKEKLNFISNFVLNPDIETKLSDVYNLSFLGTDYEFSSYQKINMKLKTDEKLNWYSTTFNNYGCTNRLILTSSAKFSRHIAYIKKNDAQINVDTDKDNINVKVNNESYSVNISKIERW